MHTRYATTSDGVRIAYQVTGDGPHDLVLCLGMISCVDFYAELPELRALTDHLSRFTRVIMFDRRGAGSSDRYGDNDVPPLELGVEDVSAVLDAVGSEATWIWGHYDGALVAALFAATHPARTRGLILHCPEPYGKLAPDWPWGWDDADWEANIAAIATGWGTDEYVTQTLAWVAPSLEPTPALIERFARYFRLAGNPRSMAALQRVLRDSDIRELLPSIRVPTLVTHRAAREVYPLESSEYVASHIPGAHLVALEGPDFAIWVDPEPLCAEIEEFVTGARGHAIGDRVLATLLFTDIVDSTRRLAAVGDRAWSRLIAEHDEQARRLVGEHRGIYVEHTGDGMLARFDGPARAIGCGLALQASASTLGLSLRAGCHTGEVELDGDRIRGITVHAAARICAAAGAGEVWASQIVRDLTAGSGLVFDDRGSHELKGLPGTYSLLCAS